MKAKLPNRRSFYVLCATYFLIYMSHGVYYPYISLYYAKEGLTDGQIGVIMAIGPFLAMAVQTLWGQLADRTNRKAVMAVTLAASALVLPLLLLSPAFGFTLLIAGLYVVVSTSTIPLSDTIALDASSRLGYRFAPIRTCGTLGFALMPVVFGGLLNGNLKAMFPLYSLFCLAACGMCLLIPGGKQARAEKEAPQAKASIRSLLRDPLLLFLLVANFVISICMALVQFIPVYGSNMGLSTNLCGLLNSVSGFCEIPLLLLIDSVLRRVKGQQVILCAAFLTAVRMLVAYLAGFFPGSAFLLLGLSQAMHSVTYIAAYYCSAQLVHGRVPERLKATAQTLIAMVSSGVSRVVGSIAAGAISDAMGLQNAFLVFGLFTLLGAGLLIPLYRLSQRRMADSAQAVGE